MKVALISTVYNEEGSVDRWIEGLSAQTAQPDEFVIVDGGSKDGTVAALERGFARGGFPKPRVIVQRCNIAEGRNIAVRNTTAEIIVSIDCGSAPDRRWLEEITKPFREHANVGVVGGWCPMVATNELQRKIERLANVRVDDIAVGGDYRPSSRNVAFLRAAWEAVGGYPEWLTLTAEDLLFNTNLHYAGYRFYYQPTAIVAWENRPDMRSFLKLMRNYGYGAGELRYRPFQYFRWLVSVIFPPVLLFSRSPLKDLSFRFLIHAAAVRGWIEGALFGHKPPDGWKRIDGVWISPQAIATAEKKK
jgi:glycosyltransferase involved in cell wall biosynthesis